MEEEAVPGLVIRGSSNCRHFMAGHKFTLERHFNADGQYVLTGVAHSLRRTGDYRSDQGGPFEYENTFTCIPIGLPFRPLRTTPKPFVQGTQTAVVVGPSGEEIFPDKYSRVKVQFHWDREGKNDLNSSCWIRVATLWAGKQWGVIHIPRIGQEVIVAFEEGDPDRPIIVGSVYNADMMPPYKLPDNKTQSGVKSRSSKNGGPANFNEIRFEDKKGEEEVYMHAERDLTTKVERDESREVDRDRTTKIGRDDTLTVGRNRKATVAMNDEETIGMNQTNKVGVSRDTTIGASDTLTVGATISVTAGGTVTITAPMITLNAATVMVSGTLMVGVGIVSPMYSPGIGNLV
jgi:type VI secretion system secreted protein VgrG